MSSVQTCSPSTISNTMKGLSLGDSENEVDGSTSKVARAMTTLVNNPQFFLEKAKEGSLTHIHAVERSIETHEFPDELFSGTLDILCQHLEDTEKKNCPTEESHIELTNKCLRCIVLMSALLGADPSACRRGLLTRAFASNWSRILDSCIIISKRAQSGLGSKGTGTTDHHTLNMIATLIDNVHDHVPHARAPLRSNRVLPMAFALWYYEETPSGFDPSKQYASRFLDWYLAERERDLPNLLKLSSEVELSADDIVDTALAKFKAVYQEFPVHAFSTDVKIIHSLLRSGDKYRHALREANAGKLLIGSFLALLQKQVVNFIEDGAAMAAAHNYFAFLFDCMKSSPGRQLMIKVIQHGVLRAIVDIASCSATGLPRSLIKDIKNLLWFNIAPFLVSYEVLASISDTMRKLSTTAVRRVIKTGGIKEEWEKFEQFVLEFQICWRLYELGYKEKVVTMETGLCQNCQRMTHVRNLQQCSGCRTILYCDRKCQASHWRQHRDECNGIKYYRTFFGFLRCITMFDVRRYWNRLGALARKKLPSGQASGERMFMINYTSRIVDSVPATTYENIVSRDSIELLASEEINIGMGVAPLGRYSIVKMIVDYAGSDGTSRQRVPFYIELIKPEFKRSGQTLQPRVVSNARAARSTLKYQNKELLVGERDEIDEILEDIYAKLDQSSDSDLDLWKALDLALPLAA